MNGVYVYGVFCVKKTLKKFEFFGKKPDNLNTNKPPQIHASGDTQIVQKLDELYAHFLRSFAKCFAGVCSTILGKVD
jgi:hypothetical protein